MAITRLALTDVRSYPDLLLEPGPGLVILSGPNGAGKTNVLEAVSLLVPGRGLRAAPLSDVARAGGPGGFAVAARLGTGDQIGVGTEAAAPERRQVRINGAPATLVALGERLAALWLTPAMDRLFTEGASGRRRFLDRLVLALEPAHATHVTRYEAAMRARNRLLAEPGGADPSWLSAIEATMGEHGGAIAAARRRTVKRLATQLGEAQVDFLPRPAIALEGWGADDMDDASALTRRLRDTRAGDARAGRALAGPHRTDLGVTHVDKGEPAARASTGEQKGLTLGLVLAHAELLRTRAERPLLLLLDEVAAHLDPERRAALFRRLAASGQQVWMTGTEAALFRDAPAPAQHLRVADGRVFSD